MLPESERVALGDVDEDMLPVSDRLAVGVVDVDVLAHGELERVGEGVEEVERVGD